MLKTRCDAMFNSDHRDTHVDATAQPAWYVVQTQRHRERLAREKLCERGIHNYLPMLLQWPPPAVGSAVQPMFPGYVFVHAALPQDFYRVSRSEGVKGFVAFGSDPTPMDPGAVEFVRTQEGPDGVVHMGTGVKEGSAVAITKGPFRGLMAVLERRLPAHARVQVLLHILQRETRVDLPEKWLSRV
jgi:transcriptional antiterminator RfaH